MKRPVINSSARMWVLAGERFASIKISGRANFSSSIDFRTVLNELAIKGYRYFVVDLSECLLMDSTFLGVLAGFGLKMNPQKPGGSSQAIELHNPNERILDLLENLGVLHLFHISQGTPAQRHLVEAIPGAPDTKEELAQACLEAHHALMEANPQNVSRFKDLTRFLAEDLKHPKSQP